MGQQLADKGSRQIPLHEFHFVVGNLGPVSLHRSERSRRPFWPSPNSLTLLLCQQVSASLDRVELNRAVLIGFDCDFLAVLCHLVVAAGVDSARLSSPG